MKVSIKVKPRSSVSRVIKIDENHYEVKVKSPPSDGRANEELKEVLSEYFGVSKSAILIICGHSSKNKIVEILR